MALVHELDYSELRRQKIIAYAKRRKLRSNKEKENDFHAIDEYQDEWIEYRMSGPARSWERWDGVVEEWTPWNRFGEPINQWRYYKK